jgi:hypothetical protein
MEALSTQPCSETRIYLPFAEPTIREILSDPITRAVMLADGVEPKALGTQLRTIAQQLAQPD